MAIKPLYEELEKGLRNWKEYVGAHAHERIQTRILKDKQLAERIDKI